MVEMPGRDRWRHCINVRRLQGRASHQPISTTLASSGSGRCCGDASSTQAADLLDW